MTSRDAPRALLILLVLVTIVAGCGRSRPSGDLSKLEVVTHSWNVDDRQGVARVLVKIRNFGENPVRKAAVKAQLLGPGDDPYESGTAIVEHIEPGEAKVFSMVIKARGREHAVEFSILDPDELEQADDEAAS